LYLPRTRSWRRLWLSINVLHARALLLSLLRSATLQPRVLTELRISHVLCMVDCSRSWIVQEDTSVDNGRVNAAASVTDCQAACLGVPGCGGLDWNPADPVGRRCWLSGTWSGRRNAGRTPNITHYDLVSSCGGKEHCDKACFLIFGCR